MENSFISKPSLRKILMYGTIATLTICAFAAIVAIFLEAESIPSILVSTLLIFYLITFFSIRSLALVNNKSIAVRCLALISLIMCICWGLPWILLVWDAFGGAGYATRVLIWQLLWTAGTIAVTCMVLAHCIAGMQDMGLKKKLANSLPITIISFAAIDLLVVIWVDYYLSDMLLWKFFLSEVILVILQVIVTQILGTDARRRQREAEEAEKQQKDAKLREMWAKNLQEQEKESKK